MCAPATLPGSSTGLASACRTSHQTTKDTSPAYPAPTDPTPMSENPLERFEGCESFALRNEYLLVESQDGRRR